MVLGGDKKNCGEMKQDEVVNEENEEFVLRRKRGLADVAYEEREEDK